MPSHAKAMTQAPHATLLSTSQGTGEVALLVWLPRKVSDAPALACALPAHIHERAMRRPGRVVGVCSAPADEVSRRTWWRMQAGWQLPAARMFWLDVSFAADGDDAEAVAAAVPACCVGSPTGLTLQRARGAAAAAVLSRLAGEAHHWLHTGARACRHSASASCCVTKEDCSALCAFNLISCCGAAAADDLSAPSPFWGAKPMEVAGVRAAPLAADPAPHAAQQPEAAPPAASPWVTAAQRSSEGPAAMGQRTPCGQQTPAPAPAAGLRRYGELQSLQSYKDAHTACKRPGMPSAALQQALQAAGAAVQDTPHGAARVSSAAQAPGPSAAGPATPNKPIFASRTRAPWLTSRPAQKAAAPAALAAQLAGMNARRADTSAALPAPRKPQLAGRKRPAGAAQAAPAKRAAPKGARKPAAKGAKPANGPGPARNPLAGPPAPGAPGPAEAQQLQAPCGGAAAAAPAAHPQRKRAKAADMDQAAVEAKAASAGGLAKLNVPELQCLLKARALPVGGKKADLVARLAPRMAGCTGAQ